MAYDITAVVACVVALAAILYDGKVSKVEGYVLLVCCLVLGATSFVVNMLDSMLFTHGVNAYVVAAVLLIVTMAFRKFTEKIRGYVFGVCALVLGSSQAVTSWLPPLINGPVEALAAFFGSM